MYDPCDFSTYIGEPEKCAGCGYRGDPKQEGRRADLNGHGVYFCGDCCEEMDAETDAMLRNGR